MLVPERNPDFGVLEDSDIAVFLEALDGDASAVVSDADDLVPFNKDWLGKYQGASRLALLPKNASQLSLILAHANKRRLAVVPQGGNTGLVGGSVAVHDEVVISAKRMNEIESLDEVSGVLVTGAGAVLETLNEFCAERGFIMPIDLGAKGSCHIGGNIATNAGGIHFARYGSLHGAVLGLEVVLADGRILDLNTSLKKDNTGYDLKQLFIGSEGTLGFITKAAIAVPTASKSAKVALLACNSWSDVQRTLQGARESLGEVLSALEFFDAASMDTVLAHAESSGSGIRNPFEDKYPFYVLVEAMGSNEEHDEEKMGAYLESMMESESIVDGAPAQDYTQAFAFWALREGITEALSHTGHVYKYDVSISLPAMYSAVEEMRERLGDRATVVGFGHMGDGNLHLNVVSPKYDASVQADIVPWLYEWIAERRGSVSAEHGVGLMKADALHYSKSPVAIDVMRDIKAVFDPNGILNPYKVLPE